MTQEHDIRHRLIDILASIAAIRARLAGRTFDMLPPGETIRDSIERRLEIISEASRHISTDLTDLHPDIDWQGVADFGNILRHAYERLAPRRIQAIIDQDLEPLKQAIENMYERVRRPGDPNPPQ